MSTNGQVVTQSDVARAAGVSRSLVSLALSGSPKVAPGTRARIQEVATSLGYRVNVAASSLARRRSSTIGVVLPNLRNAFFERLARCLGEAASARGMTLFITVGAEQPEVLHQAIESLLGVRVAGIVLVSPWLPDEDLLAIAEEVPTCLVGRRSPGGKVDAVHIDEPAAARLVVDHLVGLGACTIAYIGPSTTDEASRTEREQALAQAASGTGSRRGPVPNAVPGAATRTVSDSPASAAADPPTDATTASPADTAPPTDTDAGAPGTRTDGATAQASQAPSAEPAAGTVPGVATSVSMAVYECGRDAGPAVRAALADHPETLGLVVHNDGFAIDAVPVLREAARDRGSRVLLASYDDTYLAEREEFSLTSVSQSDEHMAARAMELLCERAGAARNDAARSVVLEPALVERASSLGREPGAHPEQPPPAASTSSPSR